MTIKQNGGVFGRNPTFNDVTVEGDLTVDGAVVHTGDLTVDNINLSGNTISITDTNGNLNLDANGAGRILSNYDVCLGNTVPNVVSNYAAQQGFGWDYSVNTLEVASNVAPLQLGRQSGGSDGQVLVIRQASNVAAEIRVASNAGYFKPYNGGGIDFSATSGTGTSELFDDYEEGTWTPSPTGGTLTINDAKYTKVGRLVTAQADVTATATTSGDWSGLPFNLGGDASADKQAGFVGYQTEESSAVWGILADNTLATFTFRNGSTSKQLTTGSRAVFTIIYYTN